MKLYQHWLPLELEDHQTALVFNALRHLPARQALEPWLSQALERPVTAGPLEVENFWPRLPSIIEGSTITEPELVFDADDGRPLLVVIENKPWVGGHTLDQITREAVDAAAAKNPKRVALVMVGADVSPPMDLADWRKQVADALRAHGLKAQVELRYSSWAEIGRVLVACAEHEPAWARYIEDVTAQLRFHSLLGYEGAPLFDDIDTPLTVPKAVDAFNRTILAVRAFYLSLHGQSGFKALGFPGPYRLSRDGTGTSPESHWFEASFVLSSYRRERWPKRLGAFVAFDLATEGDTADICAGAHWAEKGYLLDSYGNIDSEAEVAAELEALPDERFDGAGAAYGTSWVWATRQWKTGQPDVDVDWAVDQLAAVGAAFPARKQRKRPTEK
jgi:hypothetical protein